jgi:hypothetical protein
MHASRYYATKHNSACSFSVEVVYSLLISSKLDVILHSATFFYLLRLHDFIQDDIKNAAITTDF